MQKIPCVLFKGKEKTDMSAAYSEKARLEMSEESVTDILKLIFQPWLLALATASQHFCLIKKHPGVCKRVVGVSAHPDSLTY